MCTFSWHLNCHLLQLLCITTFHTSSSLQHKLHVTQKDNDTLQDNVIKKQWKVECFIGITGQLQEEATQLKQQLSDVRIEDC